MARLVFHISMSLDGFITGRALAPASHWAQAARGFTTGCPGSRISARVTQAVELEPTGTVESPSGVTHLNYRVVK
jgi:hypothetical protein